MNFDSIYFTTIKTEKDITISIMYKLHIIPHNMKSKIVIKYIIKLLFDYLNEVYSITAALLY